MRFITPFLSTCLVVLLLFPTSLNAAAADKRLQYYEIADILTTEEHKQLLDQWLLQQSLSDEERQIVDAIQAYKTNDYDLAIDTLEPLLEKTALPEAHYWAGRVYGQLASAASIFKAGSLAEKALAHFQRSVALDDTFLEGHKALVQYYLRAPFFAGGSVKEARNTAERIAQLDPIEGLMTNIQIASSEDDCKALATLANKLTQTLEQAIEITESQKNPTQLANYFFTAAMIQMQANDFVSAHNNLSVAMELANKSSATHIALNDHADLSVMAQVEQTNLNNLQQAIRYQTGRLGVLSQQDIAAAIVALNQFLSGPPHPNYKSHWAQLRLAQLLHMDGQLNQAKALVEQLPDIDDDRFTKLHKTLIKQLK